MSTFGEHLKREREMRGVSLEEISAATRISTRFLEALESEQWDRLPGGIFNRGFVRAVARFLGLDEESLVAEYALANNDRPAVAVWATNSTVPGEARRWLPWLLALLLAAALAVGGWFVWQRYASRHAARGVLLPGQSTSATQPATPIVGPETSPEAVPGGGPEIPATPAAQPENASNPRPTAEAGAGKPPILELTISAGKTSVVSVTADGKSVFDGKMNAGENHHFRAQEQFEVSSRDSSALLLEMNDQTVAPLGPPGRPGSVTLTRKDLKKAPGGPD